MISFSLLSQHICYTSFLFVLFINLFIYLFIFGCVGSLVPCAGFLQLQRAGATLCCGAQVSHCGGFFCCGARALGAQASVAVARELSSCGLWALEHRLSSCGARAQLLCSMWDLPGPGLEPMSLALAGGFLTTAPPGKPDQLYIFLTFFFSGCHRVCNIHLQLIHVHFQITLCHFMDSVSTL